MPISTRSMRLLRRHVRLLFALGTSLIAFLSLPVYWSGISRILVCWDVAVTVFLALTWTMMTRLSLAQMRSKYEEEEGTGWAILFLVTVASLLSLVAIVALLATVKQYGESARGAHFALAGITVVESWVLVPTVFTIHYADLFYSSSSKDRPLSFPSTEFPEFWDFVYFSFTIAVACQTADVATNNSAIRRALTGHAVVSFVFNVSILGFAINVSAGLLGGS